MAGPRAPTRSVTDSFASSFTSVDVTRRFSGRARRAAPPREDSICLAAAAYIQGNGCSGAPSRWYASEKTVATAVPSSAAARRGTHARQSGWKGEKVLEPHLVLQAISRITTAVDCLRTAHS